MRRRLQPITTRRGKTLRAEPGSASPRRPPPPARAPGLRLLRSASPCARDARSGEKRRVPAAAAGTSTRGGRAERARGRGGGGAPGPRLLLSGSARAPRGAGAPAGGRGVGGGRGDASSAAGRPLLCAPPTPAEVPARGLERGAGGAARAPQLGRAGSSAAPHKFLPSLAPSFPVMDQKPARDTAGDREDEQGCGSRSPPDAEYCIV
ncbi:putative cuticle collagen 91 [Vulpes lagopus]|uniref:putative cuticle collagen 91 n=1 Tax=Vulpes lagopus TaxID=494514 RepID=UPI001BCA4567|nr:putative cuticle collagen 91 [Vulpes lagopus]